MTNLGGNGRPRLANNLLKIQNDLKHMSDEQLSGQMKTPDGIVPPFMAMMEAKRREDIRKGSGPEKPLAKTAMVEEMPARLQQSSMMDIMNRQKALMQPAQPQGFSGGGAVVAFDNGGNVMAPGWGYRPGSFMWNMRMLNAPRGYMPMPPIETTQGPGGFPVRAQPGVPTDPLTMTDRGARLTPGYQLPDPGIWKGLEAHAPPLPSLRWSPERGLRETWSPTEPPPSQSLPPPTATSDPAVVAGRTIGAMSPLSIDRLAAGATGAEGGAGIAPSLAIVPGASTEGLVPDVPGMRPRGAYPVPGHVPSGGGGSGGGGGGVSTRTSSTTSGSGPMSLEDYIAQYKRIREAMQGDKSGPDPYDEIKKEIKDLAGDPKEAKRQLAAESLMMAGLGTLAGDPRRGPLAAIGEGGMTGFQYFKENRKDIMDRAHKDISLRLQMESIRRAENQGDAKLAMGMADSMAKERMHKEQMETTLKAASISAGGAGDAEARAYARWKNNPEEYEAFMRARGKSDPYTRAIEGAEARAAAEAQRKTDELFSKWITENPGASPIDVEMMRRKLGATKR